MMKVLANEWVEEGEEIKVAGHLTCGSVKCPMNRSRKNKAQMELTINGDYPAGRPFGAVMEVGDDLYLSTRC